MAQVETGGRGSDDRQHGDDDNVLRFTGDWFGPPEDLVPIGPAADADPVYGDALTADAFWGEQSAFLHEPIRASTASGTAPDGVADFSPTAEAPRAEFPPPPSVPTRARFSAPRFRFSAPRPGRRRPLLRMPGGLHRRDRAVVVAAVLVVAVALLAVVINPGPGAPRHAFGAGASNTNLAAVNSDSATAAELRVLANRSSSPARQVHKHARRPVVVRTIAKHTRTQPSRAPATVQRTPSSTSTPSPSTSIYTHQAASSSEPQALTTTRVSSTPQSKPDGPTNQGALGGIGSCVAGCS